MPNPLPRDSVFTPRRPDRLLEVPRAETGAAVEARTKGEAATEQAAGSSARPTLDDFGGRSDALGG